MLGTGRVFRDGLPLPLRTGRHWNVGGVSRGFSGPVDGSLQSREESGHFSGENHDHVPVPRIVQSGCNVWPGGTRAILKGDHSSLCMNRWCEGAGDKRRTCLSLFVGVDLQKLVSRSCALDFISSYSSPIAGATFCDGELYTVML